MSRLSKVIISILILVSSSFLLYKAIPFIEIVMEDELQPVLTTEGPARELQSEFLLDVSKLIVYADANNIELTGGELYRTTYQQRRNIVKGISWTMNSKHLQRRAIDLFVFINDKYKTDCASYEVLGEYWEQLNPNNTWGGRWRHKDCVHFERSK